MKQALVATLILLTLSGCNSAPVRIVDYEDQPVKRLYNQSISMDEVFVDIRMAAGRVGWSIIPGETQGQLTAIRTDGEHTAAVEINYDLNNYSIKYKESAGLEFQSRCTGKTPDAKAGGRCIKPTYNEWVTELNNALKLKLQY